MSILNFGFPILKQKSKKTTTVYIHGVPRKEATSPWRVLKKMVVKNSIYVPFRISNKIAINHHSGCWDQPVCPLQIFGYIFEKRLRLHTAFTAPNISSKFSCAAFNEASLKMVGGPGWVSSSSKDAGPLKLKCWNAKNCRFFASRYTHLQTWKFQEGGTCLFKCIFSFWVLHALSVWGYLIWVSSVDFLESLQTWIWDVKSHSSYVDLDINSIRLSLIKDHEKNRALHWTTYFCCGWKNTQWITLIRFEICNFKTPGTLLAMIHQHGNCLLAMVCNPRYSMNDV